MPGGIFESKIMLRAVVCTLVLGVDTTGAFHAPRTAAGSSLSSVLKLNLKSTNDLDGPPSPGADTTNQVGLVPPHPAT